MVTAMEVSVVTSWRITTNNAPATGLNEAEVTEALVLSAYATLLVPRLLRARAMGYPREHPSPPEEGSQGKRVEACVVADSWCIPGPTIARGNLRRR